MKLSKSLTLPDEISGRRTAIFGISGSGKSNTAALIVEQLLGAGEQVVMIDPKGEAWGMLSWSNGKPSNLPLIVFGQPHGHIEELSETHGPKLADFVFETRQSVALSLVGFPSDQAERTFVTGFLQRLYRRKSQSQKKWRTLVVIEEAHLFVPESGPKGYKGKEADLAGACQRIVRQGRSFGLGSLIIDQRPQDVAKRVVTQVDTVICHQLAHKLDREALAEWVRGYDTAGRGEVFLKSLAGLKPGEAWVWSPGFDVFERIQVDRRKSFDSGAAPDGSEDAEKAQRANVDLEQLRGQLAEVVESAKANDPKELRRRIAELEKQLAAKPKSEPDQAAIDRAVNAALVAQEKQMQAAIKERDGIIGQLKGRMGKAADLLHVNGEATPKVITKPAENIAQSAGIIAKQPRSITQTSKNIAPTEVETNLGKADRAILQAFYWLKDEEATPAKVAFYSDYSAGSSTTNNALGKLRHGLISGWRITADGIALVQSWGVPPKPSGDELLAWLRSKLGRAEVAMLNALVENHPARLNNEQLAELSGYSLGSSTFNNSIGRLRTLEAAQGYERDGGVKAADVFFE